MQENIRIGYQFKVSLKMPYSQRPYHLDVLLYRSGKNCLLND